ncbi:MAG: fimbrial protein FimV [Rhodoferax sp.]|nr:fimbrial protein FimV [Rhodoferax sp.]
MIAKSCRWEVTAVALAALLALGGSNALALSLGRITVQSALGEPLSAEIDISDINADEAASLKVQIASPANFKSAGLDYSPVLTGLRTVLQKRPDGRSYLRLSSDRLVQEPFVDLILDVGWQSGRVVRNYTMLFDPRDMRPAPATRPLTVPLSAPLSAPLPVTAPRAVQTPRPVAPASPPVARPPAVTAEVRTAPPAANDAQRTVTVRPGDSASRIAMTHRLSNVSLDQMLVALQRGNPNAFIAGNINRIKAGAIVALPTEKQATAVAPAQASQIITAQSQDFNRYRQALASSAGVTQLAPAERTASGTIQATVDDKKPAAQTPDKLTLSKGSVQSAADLEQMALARNAEDSAKRAAQISQNTNELNQLAQTAASMAAATAASGTADGSAATATAVPASAPGVQKPVSPALPASAPVTAPTSGFLDELVENPLLPASASALVLLLAGLAFYKVRQRQKKAAADSSFMESGFHTDSFFGNSGGQKVDTQETAGTSSATMYSGSQLDPVEDADPLAEADVYMAYGRDLQAEEVLREALLKQPERVAIHQKLLTIYAKRQDAKAYAAMATLAYPLLENNESQWAQICASGLALEPGNAMYLAGEQSVAAVPASPLPAFPSLPVMPQETPVAEIAPVVPAQPAGAPDESALDLDFDLDFSLDSLEPAKGFETVDPALPVLEAAAPSTAPTPVAAAPAAPATPTAASAPLDMLEFDFDSLSLELDDSDVVPTKQPPLMNTDALEAKLALADEFRANGDDEGARELIQQVIDATDGPLQARAQQALSRL